MLHLQLVSWKQLLGSEDCLHLAVFSPKVQGFIYSWFHEISSLGLRTGSISQYSPQRYRASFTASFVKTAPWVWGLPPPCSILSKGTGLHLQLVQWNQFLRSENCLNLSVFLRGYRASFIGGFIKIALSVYTLLMNSIYLSHSTHVAEGTVFRKHMLSKLSYCQFYCSLPFVSVLPTAGTQAAGHGIQLSTTLLFL